MLEELFTFDDEYNLTINSAVIALYPDFEQLLKRDIELRRSTSIVKKVRYFRELNYVYQISSYKSYPNVQGLSEKESHKWAVRTCGLDKDWKPDELVKSCIRTFLTCQETVSLATVTAYRKALTTSSKIAVILTENNTKLLEELENSGLTEKDFEEKLREYVTRQTTLKSLMSEISRDLKALKDSETALRKEQDTKKTGRGEITITESMKF